MSPKKISLAGAW